MILSLFTIAVGIYSVSNLSKLSDGIDVLYNTHVKGLDTARGMSISALRMVREEKNIIMANEPAEIQASMDKLSVERKQFDALAQTMPKYFTSGEGKKLCDSLIESSKAWLASHEKVVELGKTTDTALNEQAQKLSNSHARQAMAAMTQNIQKAVDFKLMRTDQLNESSTRMYESARIVTILGVLASVLVGVGLGYLMARSMLRQLGDEPASLSHLALAIAGGDLDARFDPARAEQGVFGAMKSMVSTLKTKISEAEQKGLEAAEESKKAHQATLEAEAARKQAERAKAEG